MLPVRKSGGPGKEVPPKRARTKPEKKERFARGGMPEKNAETCFEKMERICLPLPVSPCQCRRVRRENTKGGKSIVTVPLDRLCECGRGLCSRCSGNLKDLPYSRKSSSTSVGGCA
jgi:hypothetical protein